MHCVRRVPLWVRNLTGIAVMAPAVPGPGPARPQASGEAGSRGRGQCWEMQDRAEAACSRPAAPAGALRPASPCGRWGWWAPSTLRSLLSPVGIFLGPAPRELVPESHGGCPGVSVECCGLGSRAPLPAARVLLSGPTPPAHPSPASLLCRVRGVRARSVTANSGDRMGFSPPAASVRGVIQAVILTWVVVS